MPTPSWARADERDVADDYASRSRSGGSRAGRASGTSVGRLRCRKMRCVTADSSMSGKIALTYSIANFPTLRCLEQIRNVVTHRHPYC